MAYPSKAVYLAGPISNMTYESARYGWRSEFADLLPEHIHCFSPMRGKEMLAGISNISSNGAEYPDHAITTDAGITTRDFNDVKNCDAMVACFLSTPLPSLGTAIEFGIAMSFQKPIIMIGREGNVNFDHMMMRRMAGYRVNNLDEASVILTHLLTPGV